MPDAWQPEEYGVVFVRPVDYYAVGVQGRRKGSERAGADVARCALGVV
jgi:hypothetical protein